MTASHELAAPRPEDDVAPLLRQELRQRRAPRAGAEHGDLHGGTPARSTWPATCACGCRSRRATALCCRAMRSRPRRLPRPHAPRPRLRAVRSPLALWPWLRRARRRLLAERGVQARRADQRPVELHAPPQHHELRPRPVLPADDDAQRAAQAHAGRATSSAASSRSTARSRRSANGDLWVQFDGFGYAWTSLSKKVTFTSAATLQYNQDFKCADDNSIYAYFDTRTRLGRPTSASPQIEQPGRQPHAELDHALRRLVRPADGVRPAHAGVHGHPGHRAGASTSASATCRSASGRCTPTTCTAPNRVTYENLRTEVHTNERDFIGPITVDGSGARHLPADAPRRRARRSTCSSSRRREGDASLQLYYQYGAAGAARVPAAVRRRRAGRRRISARSAASGGYVLCGDRQHVCCGASRPARAALRRRRGHGGGRQLRDPDSVTPLEDGRVPCRADRQPGNQQSPRAGAAGVARQRRRAEARDGAPLAAEDADGPPALGGRPAAGQALAPAPAPLLGGLVRRSCRSCSRRRSSGR